MYKLNSLICFLLFTSVVFGQISPSNAPNALQKQQINRTYGMFVHFGINTFNEKEWSDGTLPASSYNPDKLDCDEWVKTAKEAGFKYLILITKHHDGFCLWDSKYTDYDVASSPVKTNVVKAVADACKKYGLQLGLYYSLWDRHEPTHKEKDPTAYVQYMKNQLTELLTQNGEIIEIWFDGAWAKKDEDWHIPEIYDLIKKLQPKCLVTVNHTIGHWDKITKIRQPKDMTEGDPIRFFPVDFRTKDPNIARWDDPKLYTYNKQLYYLPFEHTICLSERSNWFQKKQIMPTLSVDELEQLFYWCTANDNILIMNVPPDQHGQIRANERETLLALADRLKIKGGIKKKPTIGQNILFNQPVRSSEIKQDTTNRLAYINDYSLETWWQATDTEVNIVFDIPMQKAFDQLVIMEAADIEDLKDGFSKIRRFRIQEYSIDVMQNGQWETIYSGQEIGACKTIHLPKKMNANSIRLSIKKASAPPKINHISAYLKK